VTERRPGFGDPGTVALCLVMQTSPRVHCEQRFFISFRGNQTKQQQKKKKKKKKNKLNLGFVSIPISS
jgi:hypothetical protein